MDSWPSVPPFYRLYGPEQPATVNGRRYEAPAPPPPLEGSYRMFGLPYSTQPAEPTLAEAGVPTLSDGEGGGKDLQKIVRSVLVTYVEMVRGMEQGENQEARLGALEVMFVNMHFLCNRHRPQQATDSIKRIMRQEIERQKQLTAEMAAACDAAETLLEEIAQETSGQAAPAPEVKRQKK